MSYYKAITSDTADASTVFAGGTQVVGLSGPNHRQESQQIVAALRAAEKRGDDGADRAYIVNTTADLAVHRAGVLYQRQAGVSEQAFRELDREAAVLPGIVPEANKLQFSFESPVILLGDKNNLSSVVPLCCGDPTPAFAPRHYRVPEGYSPDQVRQIIYCESCDKDLGVVTWSQADADALGSRLSEQAENDSCTAETPCAVRAAEGGMSCSHA